MMILANIELLAVVLVWVWVLFSYAHYSKNIVPEEKRRHWLDLILYFSLGVVMLIGAKVFVHRLGLFYHIFSLGLAGIMYRCARYLDKTYGDAAIVAKRESLMLEALKGLNKPIWAKRFNEEKGVFIPIWGNESFTEKIGAPMDSWLKDGDMVFGQELNDLFHSQDMEAWNMEGKVLFIESEYPNPEGGISVDYFQKYRVGDILMGEGQF